MRQVVIIGGGITGLAAAYRLQRLTSEVSITLIERDTRLGGKIVTERVDGFVIEGAPDCFLSRKPHGIALCEELGVTDELQGANPASSGKTYVMRDGTLHRLPAGLTGLVPTNLDALANNTLISAAGRARLAQELELPAAPDKGDESIASFVSRRLGKEVFDQLIEPLMGGIYSGDASQLSLAATFPQLRQLELKYGSLIKGLLAKQNASPQATATRPSTYPPFVTFRSGMSTLVELLLERLTNSTLITGCAVESITPRSNDFSRSSTRSNDFSRSSTRSNDFSRSGRRGTTEVVTTGGGTTEVVTTDGRSFEADAVILTTPAFVTAGLVAPWDAELAAAHEAIPYASTAIVTLAYADSKLPAPLHGRGYVIPSIEATDVKACTWTSSKWAGRAADGFALIRVYLGRYGSRNILENSDQQLLRLAQNELKRTLNITAPPDITRIKRWPNAMPQYNLGHLERLAQIDTRLTHHPGLFLAGATYRGVGIPDCIRSAEQAAKGVVAHLAGGAWPNNFPF